MCMDVMGEALQTVMEGRLALSRESARGVLEGMLEAPDELRLAALLGGMAARGETEEELAGFVDALRARATPMPLTDEERAGLVDTCGTGGDRSGTFNISTAAGLVAAAAGARVAKHGNRAVTSQAGSADVLEALGVRVDHSPESAAAALRKGGKGFAFLAAPLFQPAMRAVLPVRRALGVRTAFNLLGPMSNPAGAPAQVVGVYSAKLVPAVANTLARLGTRHAFVVHGMGMDEFTVCGPTMVGEVIDGEARFGAVEPSAFGLPVWPVEALAGGDAGENAGILQRVFAGERGARRDVVVMNAAAVLIVAGLAGEFLEGVAVAERAIDTGAVMGLVDGLRSEAHSPR